MVTWSDDDSDDASEDITSNVVKALVVKVDEVIVEDASESDEEEMSDEELAETYKLLFIKWKELCSICEKQKKIIQTLTSENTRMKGMANCHEHEEVIQTLHKEKLKLQARVDELLEEVSLFKSKLEGLNKSFRLLNNGTETLDHILEENKKIRSRKGIGFDYETMNEESQKPKQEFVISEEKEFAQDTQYQTIVKKAIWICHYCGRYGHLKPYCYRLHGYPGATSNAHIRKVRKSTKKAWRIKGIESAQISHTSLKVSSKEDWYFDSGCSRHMTGVKSFITDLKPYSTSYVTFGDGAKGKIKGFGRLCRAGSPHLDDVLFVEGLTRILTSISQPCDQGLEVKFSLQECVVSSDDHSIVMKGARSKDNCYMWMPQEECKVSKCLISKEDEVKLWHKKLGHLNLKSMKKIISEDVVRGLPKLRIEEGKVCGECQIGKQTKKSHPKLQHQTTTKVLELLHMDLMGSMQVESLGGKKYAFVCVDDFSRFTWINFIREKSDTFEVFKELC